MARVGPITIGALNLTGIANLPKIVNDINRNIDRIQNAGSDQIAGILREFGQAILADPRLERRERQATIETLQRLIREAAYPAAKRHLGIVRGALAYIPMLLSTSLDTFNYFQVHLADLRKFFDVSG